jgi:dTDP-D-glucose 4,6-dehydratase
VALYKLIFKKTKKIFNWSPLMNIDKTLKKTEKAYLNEKNI